MSETKKAPVTMSEETSAIVNAACRDLFALFHNGIANCDTPENRRAVLSLAYNAIGDDAEARNLETVKGVSTAVNALVATKRAGFVAVEAELAGLSPALRALVSDKVLPENILIPLSECQGFFPQGTTETDMVKALHSMGFQLAKGSQAKSGIRLSVPRVPAAPKA